MARRIFPNEPFARTFEGTGAQRVGESAKEALARFAEREAAEIAREAKRLAEHAGRRTISRQDIRMAIRLLKE